MTEKKTPIRTMAMDNHTPAATPVTATKNFTPTAAGRGVQGNHTPTTSVKPSTPAPSPKKK